MKSVYEASNSVEAYMILDLLNMSGISGRVDGEYLQGAVGELPAIGLVRVMVNESDYAAAKKIIEEWDKNQPPESEKKGREIIHPSNKKYSFFSGFIGFICGAALVAIFYNTPVTEEGVDNNYDGKIDAKWHYVGGIISKTEIDSNFDGKIDVIHKYNRKGLIDSSESDDNFDGKFDSEASYEDGNILWSETDTNGDGFKDYREDYKYNILYKATYFNHVTKKPVKIEHFDYFRIISAEVDTDRDGITDTFYEYDNIGEIVKKIKKH